VTANQKQEEAALEIRALLMKYPGVLVEGTQFLEDRCIIDLRILDAASMVCIDYAATGANGGFRFYNTSTPPRSGEPAAYSMARLKFQLTLGCTGEDSPLEWFGWFLAGDLVSRRLLSRAQAKRWDRLWAG
jgi:hypothetical protein